ncbi:MAG TPA: undecaprenyl-diphosphate phosphatase [Ktedonosporobacter sp.]|nr:undecaprenyl-diphosphate phosphatase [Ktedonosporobacter sp.]
MNLTFWQTLFLALLQGVTELFPISSLGHTVILPFFLGWGDLVRDKHFLPLIVALHLGTSIALVIYFWRDWLKVLMTLVDSVKKGEVQTGTESWVSWLIIIGCIPAGLIGVFLEAPLKELFASPVIAASFLIVNGVILFLGEVLRRRSATKNNQLVLQKEGASRPLAELSWKEGLIIGLAQSLALIPGLSRSGVTMVAGLGVRLNHEDAARYSFLLGTPLIGAAAALEIPQLLGQSSSVWMLVIIGMLVSGVAAFLSTHFLLRYFETGRLNPFAYYCWAAGILSLILLFLFHH